MSIIKTGDTRPWIAELASSGDDMTDATLVTIRVRPVGGGDAVVDGGECDIIYQAAGRLRVSYDPEPADVDAAGYFAAEFRVTFADGRTATFPGKGTLTLEIQEAL